MLKNERGITLVELLAVLAILSIVIALISSAHLFGQKQYIKQTDEIETQDEVRFVMSQLTTDLRSVTENKIMKKENELIIGNHTYRHSGNTLYRNNDAVSRMIDQFTIEITESGIGIAISSVANKQGEQSDLETTIYFRE
ncbi:hypothetical protein BN1058_02360 [Paraliobacillus sp. PM-2]|uniref:PilW family protein n=1 Tax=Paraliobacillus sp. PM-2 TaxID=1462524 RepID=UPI00061BD8DD|nr:prepilin-type N-terminal cleavage/methylation domain-containing protein [Paraliobacillus sp. PM-2]CQR48020.1 hypothetical protein BN1058_02360 [Paraliobacillus sp. PM-2]